MTASAPVEGVLLGWNRRLVDRWTPSFESVVRSVAAGEPYPRVWSVGSRRDLPRGTDAWLLRQGGPYGVLGHGVVVSEVFDAPHFAIPDAVTRCVTVEFDGLVDEADILGRTELELVVPEVAWRYQFQSGGRVPAAANARLRRLWRDHLG
jgi:hypothetical protein